MERQTKHLIRVSTDRDISFHHSHQVVSLIQFKYHQEPSAIGAALTFPPNEDLASPSDPAYIRSEWYSFFRGLTSWWSQKDLNLRRLGLQPNALPTEL